MILGALTQRESLSRRRQCSASAVRLGGGTDNARGDRQCHCRCCCFLGEDRMGRAILIWVDGPPVDPPNIGTVLEG